MEKICIKLMAAGIGMVLAAQAHAAGADEVTMRVGFEYDDAGRLVREWNVNPVDDQNVVAATYTYDNEDRVTTVTDALNRKTVLSYDALGRVTQSVDPLGVPSAFTYDTNGRLVSAIDPKGKVTSYENDGFGQTWKQTSPDTGITTAEYNAAGLPVRMTRNDSTVTAYTYDGLGRLTQAKAGNAERNFSYDSCTYGKGRLCAAELREGGAVKNWAAHVYNPQGWLTQRWDGGVDEAGQGYDGAIAYAYDGMGRVTGISYPSGVSVGYGYSSGQLTTMTATIGGNTSAVVNNITYRPFGPADGWAYGNGLERLYQYDKNGRPFAISTGTSSTLVQSLTYAYNIADEITAITDGMDAGKTRNYQYDALGRLWKETAKGAEWKYDANGNRVSWNSAGTQTTYAVDPASNRLLSYNNPSGSRTYGYDALGNRISESAPSLTAGYTYDVFNRMRSATVNGVTTTYTVNALDQRVGKSTGAARTRFVYADQNQLLAESGPSGWTSYLWLGNELVGLVKPDQQLRFVHNDHLGRPEAVSSSAKQIVWRAGNEAWGRSIQQDAIGGLNLGFPGQYFDGETGLWYNGYRYYDSFVGYTQSDPIGLEGGSFSTYSYADANPITLVDPLGLAGEAPGKPPIHRPGLPPVIIKMPPKEVGRIEQRIISIIIGKITGKILKGSKYGGFTSNPWGFAFWALTYSGGLSCSDLDCDRNGIPDYFENKEKSTDLLPANKEEEDESEYFGDVREDLIETVGGGGGGSEGGGGGSYGGTGSGPISGGCHGSCGEGYFGKPGPIEKVSQ